MAVKRKGVKAEAPASNGDSAISAKARALVEAFQSPDADVLAELGRQIQAVDEKIAELQKKRRGMDLTRKSLDWSLNGRPKQVTAAEQHARREKIFRYLEEADEGASKNQIAEATGIPVAGVTTALKHETFACDGRRWAISDDYRERLAAAQGGRA